MKKIFTLVAMAAMAIGVNAQSEVFEMTTALMKTKTDADAKYDAIKDGYVTDVANTSPNNKGVGTKENPLPKGTTDAEAFAQAATVTLHDFTFKAETANVAMTIVSTPNENDIASPWGITDQSASNNGALNTEACSPKFTTYLAPKGNPSATYFGYWVINENSEPSFKVPNDYQTFWTPSAGAAPAKGAYATFIVKKAEKLKIGVRIPKAAKNQEIYFVKKSDGSVLPVSEYNAEGYDNNNTNEYKTYTTTADYKVVTDVNNQFIGYINVTLPANEEYVLFSPKTQIGIWGFQFGSATGIENVKAAAKSADAAIYNLAGQKVDAAFKGMVIMNGKKFINK